MDDDLMARRPRAPSERSDTTNGQQGRADTSAGEPDAPRWTTSASEREVPWDRPTGDPAPPADESDVAQSAETKRAAAAEPPWQPVTEAARQEDVSLTADAQPVDDQPLEAAARVVRARGGGWISRWLAATRRARARKLRAADASSPSADADLSEEPVTQAAAMGEAGGEPEGDREPESKAQAGSDPMSETPAAVAQGPQRGAPTADSPGEPEWEAGAEDSRSWDRPPTDEWLMPTDANDDRPPEMFEAYDPLISAPAGDPDDAFAPVVGDVRGADALAGRPADAEDQRDDRQSARAHDEAPSINVPVTLPVGFRSAGAGTMINLVLRIELAIVDDARRVDPIDAALHVGPTADSETPRDPQFTPRRQASDVAEPGQASGQQAAPEQPADDSPPWHQPQPPAQSADLAWDLPALERTETSPWGAPGHAAPEQAQDTNEPTPSVGPHRAAPTEPEAQSEPAGNAAWTVPALAQSPPEPQSAPSASAPWRTPNPAIGEADAAPWPTPVSPVADPLAGLPATFAATPAASGMSPAGAASRAQRSDHRSPASEPVSVSSDETPAAERASLLTATLTVGMAVLVIILVLIFIQLMTSLLR